jgi:hypothetical protein
MRGGGQLGDPYAPRVVTLVENLPAVTAVVIGVEVVAQMLGALASDEHKRPANAEALGGWEDRALLVGRR